MHVLEHDSYQKEVEIWKEVYKLIFKRGVVSRLVSELKNYIVGFLCEVIAKTKIEEVFKACYIEQKDFGQYDFVVTCSKSRIYVEVKSINLMNVRYWKDNPDRMYIRFAIDKLLEGNHYLYLFVDPRSGKCKFVHLLILLKELERYTSRFRFKEITGFDSVNQIVSSFLKALSTMNTQDSVASNVDKGQNQNSDDITNTTFYKQEHYIDSETYRKLLCKFIACKVPLMKLRTFVDEFNKFLKQNIGIELPPKVHLELLRLLEHNNLVKIYTLSNDIVIYINSDMCHA